MFVVLLDRSDPRLSPVGRFKDASVLGRLPHLRVAARLAVLVPRHHPIEYTIHAITATRFPRTPVRPKFRRFAVIGHHIDRRPMQLPHVITFELVERDIGVPALRNPKVSSEGE